MHSASDTRNIINHTAKLLLLHHGAVSRAVLKWNADRYLGSHTAGWAPGIIGQDPVGFCITTRCGILNCPCPSHGRVGPAGQHERDYKRRSLLLSGTMTETEMTEDTEMLYVEMLGGG